MKSVGKYFDGLSSQPQKVDITLYDDCLKIDVNDDELVWPFSQLYSPSDQGDQSKLMLFQSQSHSDYLEIVDLDVIKEIKRKKPKLTRYKVNKTVLKKTLFWGFGAAISLYLCLVFLLLVFYQP